MFKLKSSFLVSVLISILCSALISCGKKGPLYIPEQRYPIEATKPVINTDKNGPNKAAPTLPTQTQPTIKE